jgi:aspartate carbamoyltransferase catalytic subunit
VIPRFRNLLGTEPLSREQIEFILDQTRPFQEFQRHPLKKLATLRGKTVALAFFEPSTRTRISFATAASRLGADTMNLQAESSSLKKGESLLDTVWTLEAMKPDIVVMRHSSSGAAEFVARHIDVPVINAGRRFARASQPGAAGRAHDSRPQGLTRELERHDSRRYSAQPGGPLEHSPAQQIWRAHHAVRSADVAAAGTGIACPQYPPGVAHRGSARWRGRGDGAARPDGTDARARAAADEYIRRYQLTPERLRLARPDAIVMHPGPMIRGLEIDPAVADGPQSCVLEQVTNGLAVRMTLLFHLISAPATDAPHPAKESHASD